MVFPAGVGVVDTLMGLPNKDRRWWATAMAGTLRDEDSRSGMTHPAGYMFKDLPDMERSATSADDLVAAMDAFGVDKALIPVSFADEGTIAAVKQYPDRLLGSFQVDPSQGIVEGVRALRRAHEEAGIVAASFFPCGCTPPVPIDDRAAYPLYAACVELGLPVFVNAGIPGPRVPATAQDVMRFDQVCYDFPELTVVMRHGGEPWCDLAVKLMLKWPGLHWSSSAFAPKHYPRAIIDYANTRGADKILYAGYFPYGLTLDRIFSELPHVPLKAEVWPKFLRENALRVLGIA
ncbi:amidohydrolase family protein [Uniformispora flossi]|uniref:amidohydrolase family protein n=1 Tax=Uniformispora flossi TaxID=3390723 RepID=UPI003C2AF6E5